jgi:hypothetical protein
MTRIQANPTDDPTGRYEARPVATNQHSIRESAVRSPVRADAAESPIRCGRPVRLSL